MISLPSAFRYAFLILTFGAVGTLFAQETVARTESQEAPQDAKPKKLMTEETRQTGQVGWDVYL